jgi:hypothetical protein
MKHEFHGRILKGIKTLHFMKIHVVLWGRTDRRTGKQAGKHEEANIRFSLTRIGLGRAAGKRQTNERRGMC